MENVVLVTMDGDSARLPKPFTRRLCFSHCLSHTASLRRRVAMLEPSSSLLGVSDLVPLETGGNGEQLCADLIAEVQKLGCLGVFLDFEQNYPLLREALQCIDAGLSGAGIPLYVPERCAGGLSHAVAVCEAAVSGGSFDQRFRELMIRYGAGRVAAMLQPVCASFLLPSQDADGTPLTPETLDALRTEYGSQVFFSKELCAKYFTYMDAENQGHFVLFDDKSTMQEKHRRLARWEIPCFLMARDAELLL